MRISAAPPRRSLGRSSFWPVLARGKTRMLTRRLAHLVLERGVPANACLAITFTRRAAAELKERLAALIPAEAGACVVHSFHSLGLAMLRADGSALGLDANFRVADERQRATALAREMQIPEAEGGAPFEGAFVAEAHGR